MTDHSYAARAVLIAEAKSRCLREKRGCHPGDPDWNGCYICVHRGGLAAALRAVASTWETEISGQPRTEFISGIRNCITSLREIAEDLEAQS